MTTEIRPGEGQAKRDCLFEAAFGVEHNVKEISEGVYRHTMQPKAMTMGDAVDMAAVSEIAFKQDEDGNMVTTATITGTAEEVLNFVGRFREVAHG